MQLMLRRVGFGDGAGSGISTILYAWNQVDWVESDLCEDTHLNQVTLTLKTLVTWTESVDEFQASALDLPNISENSEAAIRSALSIYNLGISLEVRADLIQVANVISNALENYNQLDLSGLKDFVMRFSELSKMMQPISDNARNLTVLISEILESSVESANKSAEKSANKSDGNVGNLTKRQAQILSIMEDEKEYSAESIAAVIELKGPRTRQLMNELVELGKIERIGTTKDRRYKKIPQ